MMPSPIRKIAVPTDFSDASEHAAGYAAALARRLNASLYLIHVLDLEGLSEPKALEVKSSETAFRDRLYQGARARLDALAAKLDAGPQTITTEVRCGAPAYSIAQAVLHYGADVVLMAPQGRSGLSHLISGSVIKRVVRTAPCPVLVVRASGQVRVHRQPGSSAGQAA
jgi:nucleotide-binding universal stress UspA family protein